MTKPKLGLVLGSGSARGWAHVGVIRELESMGIKPDLVVGSSVGSLVGGAYASGNLDKFEEHISSFTRGALIKLIDFHPNSGGFLKGNRVLQSIEEEIGNPQIEDLQIPFACVTTSLLDGKEHWFQNGSLLDAIHASIALPGIFAPVARPPNIFIDGGLVNPVPISLARAMGADYVIAVNLNAYLVAQEKDSHPRETTIENQKRDYSQNNSIIAEWASKLKTEFNQMEALISLFHNSEKPAETSLFEVIARSINIMQNDITISSIAKDKPDIEITPKLDYFRLMEFNRANEAISEGRRATRIMENELQNLKLKL